MEIKQELKYGGECVGVLGNPKKWSSQSTDDPQTAVLPCPKRTQGDGMEYESQESDDKLAIKKIPLRDTLIYHPINLNQSYCPPVTPTGKIINLIPRNVTQVKKDKILHSLKVKEPKFIPYEPYKAAVNPIIPNEKKSKRGTRNNLDINEMVAQMSIHKSIEMKKNDERYLNISKELDHNQLADQIDYGNTTADDGTNEPLKCWLSEKQSYESEIKKLKDENSQLENQLKFQAQVNGELKNLLVAAVGEDLQTKVNLLTEDKLQLSRALLNSSKHLSTHQEQTEWLAGQCEVWRSKFLASSLMVEELAKWKAALCQRTTDLQESIKRLLEERAKVRDNLLKTYKTLSLLRENFDPVGNITMSRKYELSSSNIIGLSEGCYNIGEILKVQLLGGMENLSRQKEINITGLEMKTIGELNAEQLLMNPNVLLSERPDAACSAVMGAAFALSGQMCLPSLNNDPNIVCCPHCSGEVKQV